MRLFVALFVVFSCLHQALAGGVLAIDYGTEWMKVSLVKAGVPFDVLLNT
jgi:hypoxia up-regulated 1